jgi:hypothetical protein
MSELSTNDLIKSIEQLVAMLVIFKGQLERAAAQTGEKVERKRDTWDAY